MSDLTPQLQPLLPSSPTAAEASPAEATTTEGLRPVKVSEVIALGKKSCRTCFGAGSFNRQALHGSPPELRVCGCAAERFLKVNAKRLTYHAESSAWFWLPENK